MDAGLAMQDFSGDRFGELLNRFEVMLSRLPVVMGAPQTLVETTSYALPMQMSPRTRTVVCPAQVPTVAVVSGPLSPPQTMAISGGWSVSGPGVASPSGPLSMPSGSLVDEWLRSTPRLVNGSGGGSVRAPMGPGSPRRSADGNLPASALVPPANSFNYSMPTASGSSFTVPPQVSSSYNIPPACGRGSVNPASSSAVVPPASGTATPLSARTAGLLNRTPRASFGTSRSGGLGQGSPQLQSPQRSPHLQLQSPQRSAWSPRRQSPNSPPLSSAPLRSARSTLGSMRPVLAPTRSSAEMPAAVPEPGRESYSPRAVIATSGMPRPGSGAVHRWTAVPL